MLKLSERKLDEPNSGDLINPWYHPLCPGEREGTYQTTALAHTVGRGQFSENVTVVNWADASHDEGSS